MPNAVRSAGVRVADDDRSQDSSVRCAADHRRLGPKSSLGRRILGRAWEVGQLWAEGLGAAWGLSAVLVEIPAARRGYDGGGGAGVDGGERVVALWARGWGVARGLGAALGEIPAARRGYDGGGARVAARRARGCCERGVGGRLGGWVLFASRYPRRSAGMTVVGARVWRWGRAGGGGGEETGVAGAALDRHCRRYALSSRRCRVTATVIARLPRQSRRARGWCCFLPPSAAPRACPSPQT